MGRRILLDELDAGSVAGGGLPNRQADESHFLVSPASDQEFARQKLQSCTSRKPERR
jgi:hypothetical protein